MAICFLQSGYLWILLITTCAAYDVTPMLLKQIERLDAKIGNIQEAHSAEIDRLEEKLLQQQTELIDQKVELKKLEARYVAKISDLDQRLENAEKKYELLEKKFETIMEEVKEDKQSENMSIASIRKDMHESSNNDNVSSEKRTQGSNVGTDDDISQTAQLTGARQNRAVVNGNNIAFSAYMDHDVKGLGVGQALRFNQLLLNDGNAYNMHSGVFTAPVAGVYSFSFFVGERGVDGIWVALYVNSENKMDAAVDTQHAAQDLQGGNTVNLKLAASDVVSIVNLGGGHIEGSDNPRLTSFSGFLIYPVESPTSVVGK